MATWTIGRWPRCRSPAPVPPGQTVNVQIAWTSRVPRTFARTGAIGNYYFLAQWFPKIGVLEDTGWNCHQFHAATEFFSDFGVYDVRLTVPSGWMVGATGTRAWPPRRRRRHDDASVLCGRRARFRLDDEPGLRRAAASASSTHGLPAVSMRLLLQPEHVGQAERHFHATRAALQYYGEWFGAVPVRPHHDHRSGVAERRGRHGYPTLFTAGTRWLAPRAVAEPEGVTVHEAGHSSGTAWSATNEFEHAWMDEGLNTFSDRAGARPVLRAAVLRRSATSAASCRGSSTTCRCSRATDGNRLSGYRDAARAPIAQSAPTWRYWPETAGAITYNKTALWLNTLERMLGWDTLQRILSTTSRAARSGTPSRRTSSRSPTR